MCWFYIFSRRPISGAENAANVSLEVLKTELPRLQERDQSRGRFGGGRGGFGDRNGGGRGRFSGGRGSRGGFSERRNGRYNSKRW